jgi:hypothetical protein
VFRKIGKVFVIWMLSASSALAVAIGEEKKQLIDELSKLFNSPAILEQFTDTITGNLLDTLALQAIEIDDQFHRIIRQTASEVGSDIIFNNSIIRCQNYRFSDKHYEIEELEGLRAFFKSVIGKKYINKMPEMAIETTSSIMSVQEEFAFTI